MHETNGQAGKIKENSKAYPWPEKSVCDLGKTDVKKCNKYNMNRQNYIRLKKVSGRND